MTDDLEKSLEDSYIISVPKTAVNTAQETQHRYVAMLQMTEQLQQQHGRERFSVTWKYQFIAAIAATIKDNGLVEMLKSEGYIVERQARIRK
ncbi:TPA: hypothetical protein HA231_03230 [Candidatus Woesearchaeota archaeon]|nr:hypothetical protein [Candidatus Woesearchaeota archaeon]